MGKFRKLFTTSPAKVCRTRTRRENSAAVPSVPACRTAAPAAAEHARKVSPVSLVEFHPELRSRARVIPKAPIRPLTLPFFRIATRLQARKPARGVEQLRISDHVGIRLYRPEGR